MKDIKLLDCTLRDGGYVNDWCFGYSNIVNIFERLVSSRIDMIEVGFIDERVKYDRDRTIFPNCASINETYSHLNKGSSLIVGMIDYGTCGIDKILPKEACFLDGIRVIFKKSNRVPALAFCKQIKDLGYKVFVQAVSITSYDDEELTDLLNLVNALEPYSFSLVDTYGLLHKDHLLRYFVASNKQLKKKICLGYHSHNNFQLAYSNCIQLIEDAPEDRTTLLDGSLYGMGKGAGNAPIELLTMNVDHEGKKYDISQILEAIDVSILEIFRRIPWGYSFKFYLAASHDCHPNYVTYLMDKKTLSIRSINEILCSLEGDKKLLYSESYIEDKYISYQKVIFDDSKEKQALKSLLENREVLLIGPGNTSRSKRSLIQKYIDEHKPVVIAVNFIPELKIDYVFVTNSRRYVQLSTSLDNENNPFKVISTSNITKSRGSFDFTIEYSSLLDVEASFKDNPLIMLLKLLDLCHVASINLAGFDGYTTAKKSDYINPNMAYSFTKERAREINIDTILSLTRLQTSVPRHFITKSYYDYSR